MSSTLPFASQILCNTQPAFRGSAAEDAYYRRHQITLPGGILTLWSSLRKVRVTTNNAQTPSISTETLVKLT